MQKLAQSNIIRTKKIGGDCMTNMYEHRLHQINIILNAYTQENNNKYAEEIKQLEEERNNILQEINYMS